MTDLAEKARAGRLAALGFRGTAALSSQDPSVEGARYRVPARQENVIFFSRRHGGKPARLVL
ncbi:hypothetical protein [Pseudogemmobacter blasticus]|uniref:Uncharacterized protein n=1 Tax=Fuscovulum blasticum DSM 2131 TaxID=1188250 RepID=A0A2T4JCK8_FUSBL|nr:hypothetical protein [Fuscovulum blasticum]PTE15583.1 hypothetical protein C5F44_04205 [Fuscovulum blasticum DSM 2131]